MNLSTADIIECKYQLEKCSIYKPGNRDQMLLKQLSKNHFARTFWKKSFSNKFKIFFIFFLILHFLS